MAILDYSAPRILKTANPCDREWSNKATKPCIFAVVAFKQLIRGESDKHVCKLVLRTSALLDTLLAEDAHKARVEAAVTVPVSTPTTPNVPRRRAFIEVDSDEEDIVNACNGQMPPYVEENSFSA
ncbi:hypothetical protein FB451DRAFT_1172752 [Mycena latifolia]|nr:hypothetical protein FB451DRAFT_1172752 [Mycena latifolia]